MKLLGDGKKNSAELGTEAKMKVKAGNLKLEGRRQQAHGVPMEGEGGGISATRCATLGGGLSLVQYEATGGFKSGALLHAAESGDIEQVKSLCRKYRNRATGDDDPIADEDVMFHAARSANLELVQVSTCGRRAGSGGLTTKKKWLRANGGPWGIWASDAAAGEGRLEVLQWLRANGCPWAHTATTVAALRGQLHTLRWARKNGCELDEVKACASAAMGGHLHILQWLRANGCEWNKDTRFEAAAHGHAKVLSWARENGCDWDAENCALEAAHRGHLEVLQCMRAKGLKWTDDPPMGSGTAIGDGATCFRAVCGSSILCANAASAGHLHILKWLRANGCPWNEVSQVLEGGVGVVLQGD